MNLVYILAGIAALLAILAFIAGYLSRTDAAILHSPHDPEQLLIEREQAAAETAATSVRDALRECGDANTAICSATFRGWL